MQLNPIRFMRLSVFKPRVAMSLFNALNDRHLEHPFGHLIDILGHGLAHAALLGDSTEAREALSVEVSALSEV